VRSAKEKKLKKTVIILTVIAITITIIFTLFQIIRIQDIVMRYFFPKNYSEYVERYAKEFDIDPLLIYSIIRAESGFDTRARSRAGAVRINASNGEHRNRSS